MPLRIRDGVRRAARALEGQSPVEILRWATAQVPRVAFATGFGAEGCVLIDVIARAQLPVDIFTLDTGVLFPETYALWRALAWFLGTLFVAGGLGLVNGPASLPTTSAGGLIGLAVAGLSNHAAHFYGAHWLATALPLLLLLTGLPLAFLATGIHFFRLVRGIANIPAFFLCAHGATMGAVQELRDVLRTTPFGLQFEIDDVTHKVITKVVDRDTGEVIRQLPSEEMVRIAHAMNKLQGLLVRQSA